MSNIDSKTIVITGCDFNCTMDQVKNTRNNIDGEFGKNRLSLKDWCKQENLNSKCIYNIVQDGDENNDGLRWFEKTDSTYFKMTEKGVIDIYGNYEYTQTPVITVAEGSIYLDETHDYFDEVITEIKSHPIFKNCGGYNDDIKNRKIMFSKNELKIAEEVGIKLGTIKIKDNK